MARRAAARARRWAAALCPLVLVGCSPLEPLEALDEEVEAVAGSGADAAGGEDASQLFRGDRVVELRIEMAPEAWQAILDDPRAEVYQPADLRYGDLELGQVAIRTKGNSSLMSTAQMGSHRFPFKIDIDRLVADQRLLGKKKLVLNNGFKDPSFMREHLAYAMMRDFGLPAPRTGFVDLWVAGEHLGLYTLAEVVDGDFLEERFADDSGDMYKPEPPAGWLADLGDDIAAYQGLDVERNADTTDHAAFFALIGALSRGAPLEPSLDVDEALRYLAASTALVNLDSYQGMGHNYYLYEQGGAFTIIPWDLNEAFGAFTCSCDLAGLIDFLVDEPTCGPLAQRPLVARLLESEARRTRYHAHLQALLADHLDAELLQPQIEATAALLRPYVVADPTRFYSVEEFERQTATGDAALQDVGSLLGFVRARATAVQAQLDGLHAAAAEGAGACPGNQQPPPPPPDQACSAEQPCPEGAVCALEVGRCVPDCRQRGCPPERPVCNSDTGLCDPA